MSLLDSFKKTVTKTVKDAAKASGELVDQTKLKLKIIDIKDEIESRYEKIGELYYDVVEHELDCGEKLDEIVDEIRALKSELEEIEAEVKKNKKIIKCPVCGNENDVENDYCAKCGNKIN